jgi:membrane protease YdiL (CAAX protease family)
VRAVPTPVWLLCGLLVLLSQSVGYSVVQGVSPDALGGKASLERHALTSLGSYVSAAVIGLLMVYLLRPRAPKAGLEFKPSDVGRGAIAFLLSAPILLCVGWVAERFATLIGGKAPDTVAHETLRTILDHRDSVWGWLIGLCAVVGAPLVEELIHRAFIQSALLSFLERAWPAIFGAATIFTAMHVLGGGPVPMHALPSIFTLGLAMGIAFERTRSIAVPITMHALFNLANIVVAVAAH